MLNTEVKLKKGSCKKPKQTFSIIASHFFQEQLMHFDLAVEYIKYSVFEVSFVKLIQTFIIRN